MWKQSNVLREVGGSPWIFEVKVSIHSHKDKEKCTVDGWQTWQFAKLFPKQPVFESSVVIKSMVF